MRTKKYSKNEKIKKWITFNFLRNVFVKILTLLDYLVLSLLYEFNHYVKYISQILIMYKTLSMHSKQSTKCIDLNIVLLKRWKA